MSKTSIEWTDFSVNPIRARLVNKRMNAGKERTGHYCEKVSPECKHCYASRMQPRFGLPMFEEQRRPDVPIEHFLDRKKLEQVERRQIPTKWFWEDMSDLFGWWVTDAWLDECFATMALTPQHTHQVLTKRSDRMLAYLSNPHRRDDIAMVLYKRLKGRATDIERRVHKALEVWPLPNVWCGVSAGTQASANKHVPLLLQTPAAVRFISGEPLLGAVNLEAIEYRDGDLECRWNALTGEHWIDNSTSAAAYEPTDVKIDMVIAGGESGQKARPSHPLWFRSLRDQCVGAGVKFFFKQWGAWMPLAPIYGTDDHYGDIETSLAAREDRCEILTPHSVWIDSDGQPPSGAWMMERVGKKKAGRVLDGRTWDEFPSTVAA